MAAVRLAVRLAARRAAFEPAISVRRVTGAGPVNVPHARAPVNLMEKQAGPAPSRTGYGVTGYPVGSKALAAESG